ncbi:MAG: flavin reductase family protein [Bacteroidia bacterium]|nr:flavin reductase family protein [Bacteroidia bacterium]
MSFRTIDPREIKTQEMHAYMLGAIAPRPIAFVSSIDKDGLVNLSPFSFFNAFGSNPPMVIFSPALRGRDGHTKHTLENVRQVDEVVINIVSYDMVQQMSLASTEYPKGTNEFIKSGFSMQDSVMVKPPRVRESPAQLECKVRQIIQTGVRGGAANLVLCEIVLLHLREDVLGEQGSIDPFKIDQVARLGGNWYSRASRGLFEVPKPLTTLGMGVDRLPEEIRLSKVLTGNDLGLLGNTENLPTQEEISSFTGREDVKKLFDTLGGDSENLTMAVHLAAHHLLEKGQVNEAWNLLLARHQKQ